MHLMIHYYYEILNDKLAGIVTHKNFKNNSFSNCHYLI